MKMWFQIEPRKDVVGHKCKHPEEFGVCIVQGKVGTDIAGCDKHCKVMLLL